MTSLFGRLFNGHAAESRAPSRGDVAYAQAMNKSDELLTKLRESHSQNPAVAVMADIWAQKNNVPFMVTITETVVEMTSPVSQLATDRSTPKSE